MASISAQLVQESNMSAVTKAAQEAKTASNTVNSKDNSQVSSFEFLQLLTQQLKYQDPTNPMDNSQMLAQEAQFSTLEQMEALQSGFSEFASVYKANSLMGQVVEIDNNGDTITGVVDYVNFNDVSGASVSVDGKNYPLSDVKGVYQYGIKQSEADSAAEDRSIIKETLSVIGDNIGNLAQKLIDYIN